jgi:hypothetical protein
VFFALPVDEIIRALDAVLDAPVAVANRGFVAVDFYFGAIIYDCEYQQVHPCDLDSYRSGQARLHPGNGDVLQVLAGNAADLAAPEPD